MFINLSQPQYNTFGKINNQRLVIAPNISKFVTISIKSSNNILNPITKVFLDKLLLDFNKAAAIGRIAKQNTNLYPLLPIEAGSNVYNKYETYINTIFDGFMDNYKIANDIERLITFEDTNEEFTKFLIRMKMPNTFSAYIMSRYNSIQATGLSVKLFDQRTLIKDISQDPNYKFYVNTVTNNGFLIDSNNQGTIILNLAHEAVIREMNNRGITKLSEFYSMFYVPSEKLDITFLASLLTKKYNSFCGSNPFAHPRKECVGTEFTQDVVARNLIDFKNLYSKYDLLYWLKIYLYFRGIETHKNWTQQDFDFYVTNLTNIYKSDVDNSYNLGLQYVKNLVGTYPYPQSLEPVKFYYEPRL